ncbi:MAG: glycosyltransferase family 39 protein [Elusimicrobia bacterium]|nr:glycosyltransferase family 39 protein [Candidatus Liberimonas magnetica]
MIKNKSIFQILFNIKINHIALMLVMLFALIIRLPGITNPFTIQEEKQIMNQSIDIVQASQDYKFEGYSLYGLIQVLTSGPMVFLAGMKHLMEFEDVSNGGMWCLNDDVRIPIHLYQLFYSAGRTLNILLSLLLIYLFFRISEKMFNSNIGIINAIILAIFFTYVHVSIYVHSMVPFLILFIGVLWCIVEILKANEDKYYIYAIILSSFATLILFRGVMLFGLLVLVYISQKILYKEKIKSNYIVLFAAIYSTIYFIFNTDVIKDIPLNLENISRAVIVRRNYDAVSFYNKIKSAGLGTFILFLISFFSVIKYYSLRNIILFIIALLYFIPFLKYADRYPSDLLPSITIFLLLSGEVFVNWKSMVGKLKYIFIASIVIVLLENAALSFYLDYKLLKKEHYETHTEIVQKFTDIYTEYDTTIKWDYIQPWNDLRWSSWIFWADLDNPRVGAERITSKFVEGPTTFQPIDDLYKAEGFIAVYPKIDGVILTLRNINNEPCEVEAMLYNDDPKVQVITKVTETIPANLHIKDYKFKLNYDKLIPGSWYKIVIHKVKGKANAEILMSQNDFIYGPTSSSTDLKSWSTPVAQDYYIKITYK